jgi:carbonic anhydrase
MAFGSFHDPADNVRKTAARLAQEPALLQIEIRGFVFDVDTGALQEVDLER